MSTDLLDKIIMILVTASLGVIIGRRLRWGWLGQLVVFGVLLAASFILGGVVKAINDSNNVVDFSGNKHTTLIYDVLGLAVALVAGAIVFAGWAKLTRPRR